MVAIADYDGDDSRVAYHKARALRSHKFWLACPYLWIKVQAMSMLSTLDISLTWRVFMSTTGRLLI